MVIKTNKCEETPDIKMGRGYNTVTCGEIEYLLRKTLRQADTV